MTKISNIHGTSDAKAESKRSIGKHRIRLNFFKMDVMETGCEIVN
jgi:hypothetical protein